MTNVRSCFRLAVLAAAASMPGLGAGAAPIASDDFESYAVGQLHGKNGGAGFAGPYVVDAALLTNPQVVNQSLNYSGGAVTVNGGTKAARFFDVANSNNLISRPFASQGSDPVYFSFLYRTNNPSATSEDFVQIGLSDVTTGEPKTSVGSANTATGNAPPPVFFVRVPNAGTAVPSTTTLVENTTYLVVGKASKGAGSSTYNRIDLYVNPTTLTEPVAATATGTSAAGTGAASVSNLIVRTARLDAGDEYFLDNVTIGTSYGDVVPEPGALGLLGAGAGLFLRNRRWQGRP